MSASKKRIFVHGFQSAYIDSVRYWENVESVENIIENDTEKS